MGGNQIKSIEASVFEELIILKELHIDNNKISKLVPNSFKGIKSIEKLNLGGNQIKSFEASVFEELINIKELCIDNNKISKLVPASFKG